VNLVAPGLLDDAAVIGSESAVVGDCQPASQGISARLFSGMYKPVELAALSLRSICYKLPTLAAMEATKVL
jgi:hypothetical protein